MEKDIHYSYDPEGVNAVIDELSATSFVALRNVRWSDEDEYHTDIRRYFIKQDGTEMPGKGTAIANPDKLAETLIDVMYGNTEKVISSIAKRDDYISSMGRFYSSYNNEEYESFKSELDAERDKAILDRGMSHDEFLEHLK